MAVNGLGCLIMTAVIDPRFRERLVAEPADVMGDFELTQDEREVLASIQAGSFTELAARLHKWLEQRDLPRLGPGRLHDPIAVDRDCRRGPARWEEMSETAVVRQHVSGMPALHPLHVETARGLRPRRGFGREIEFAIPGGLGHLD